MAEEHLGLSQIEKRQKGMVRKNTESLRHRTPNSSSYLQDAKKIHAGLAKPIGIFFSYAHRDSRLMDRVRQQLVLFDRQGLIDKWFDREIPPGADWSAEIDCRLAEAHIILLFVSPAYFDSDYCDAEMREALRRHKRHEAVVIPVILRPSLWESAPFGHLQALPEGGRPITQWPDRDEACKNVAKGIMEAVEQLRQIRGGNA